MPDFVVRLLALFLPQLRMFTPTLGKEQRFSAAKAQRLLGFAPRPATATVVDCARSLD
jgi:hypothetical protein